MKGRYFLVGLLLLITTLLASTTAIAAGPTDYVAYYNWDTGSGDTLYDQSDNNYDGTITAVNWDDTDYPTYNQSGDGSPYSGGFDGSGDYVEFSSEPFNDLIRPGDEDYSISGWFKTRDSSEGYIFNNNPGSMGIRMYDGDLNVWREFEGSSNTEDKYAISENRWYHFAYVYDAQDGSTLYVDSVERDSSNKTGAIRYDSGGSTMLGWDDQQNDGREFDGNIDDVAIYDRALTDSEVSDLYNDGISDDTTFTPPEATTEPSTDITSDSAVMHGDITPNDASGQEVDAYFLIKRENETDYTQTTIQVINTSTQTEYNTTVTGLDSDTTYNNSFCIDYEDDTETSQIECGDTLDFTTGQLEEPEAETKQPYDVTSNSTVLQGNVTENDGAIDLAYFVVENVDTATSETYASTYEPSTDTYFNNLTGLDSDTQYNYSICADYTMDGDTDTVCGDGVTFHTLKTPGVVTGARYLYYDFNEGMGNVTEDNWGDVDATLYTPDDATPLEWINATPNFDVEGDGDPHAVDMNDEAFTFTPDINTTELSVSFWMRKPSSGGDPYPYIYKLGDWGLQKNDVDTGQNIDYLNVYMLDDEGEVIKVEIYNPDLIGGYDYSSDWDNVIVSIDGEQDEFAFYVNGEEHTDWTVLQGDISDIADDIVVSEQSWIGGNQYQQYLGDMDEFKVYTEFLTEEDAENIRDYGSVEVTDTNETYTPPDVITNPATDINVTRAVLNGEVSVNDNAGDTFTTYFLYKKLNETDYSTSDVVILDSNVTTTASIEQSGLDSNTSHEYKYCIDYYDDEGDLQEECGSDEQFTTLSDDEDDEEDPGVPDTDEETLDTMWDTLLQGSSTAKMILGFAVVLGVLFTGVRVFGENNQNVGTYGYMILSFIGVVLATVIGLLPGFIMILMLIGGVLMAVLKGLLFSGSGGGD